MIRKQIYVEERQEALLKSLAAAEGCSEAEIIREALDRHAASLRRSTGNGDPKAWNEARAFIDELIALGPIPGGRSWRREDVYAERLGRHEG